MFECNGFSRFTLREWRETWFFAGFLFVFAELNKTAVFADLGIDCFASLWVVAKKTGVIVAFNSLASENFVIEWTIEIAKHFNAIELRLGDKVEIFLDHGGKLIVDNILEMINEEASNKLADWSREKFALVGAVFFGYFLFGDLIIFEFKFGNLAFFALAFALYDVAAGLNGGHDGCIS